MPPGMPHSIRSWNIVFGSRRAPQHPELALWCLGPGLPHTASGAGDMAANAASAASEEEKKEDKTKEEGSQKKKRSGTFVKIF